MVAPGDGADSETFEKYEFFRELNMKAEEYFG